MLVNFIQSFFQTVTLHCFLEEEPFVQDSTILQLIHPQLELTVADVGRGGQSDEGDLISFILELHHQVMYINVYVFVLVYQTSVVIHSCPYFPTHRLHSLMPRLTIFSSL